METAPMITIRMAMTIATMGRLMKNFDIGLRGPFGRARFRASGLLSLRL